MTIHLAISDSDLGFPHIIALLWEDASKDEQNYYYVLHYETYKIAQLSFFFKYKCSKNSIRELVVVEKRVLVLSIHLCLIPFQTTIGGT